MTNSRIKIVAYEKKYARTSVQMWRISKRKALGIEDVHSFNGHLNYLDSTLAETNRIFLAIELETDLPVGLIAIAGSEISQLYVDVDYQQQGIGSRLLKLAKRLAGERLILYAFEQNRTARAFYERHGFKAIGESNDNEEGLPALLYEWVKG